jgi:hypothetical protein
MKDRWAPRWNRLLTINPNYRALWEAAPEAWARALDRHLWDIFPSARGEIPAPAHDPGWPELARRGELCEFRQLERDAGCCGPRYKCVGGRRAGQVAEPITLCVECMRALDAATAAGRKF